jgi:hypothetical protein
VGTILQALFSIAEVSSAIFAEGIKRTMAEKAVEPLAVLHLVTGEFIAFPVAEKR